MQLDKQPLAKSRPRRGDAKLRGDDVTRQAGGEGAGEDVEEWSVFIECLVHVLNVLF